MQKWRLSICSGYGGDGYVLGGRCGLIIKIDDIVLKIKSRRESKL